MKFRSGARSARLCLGIVVTIGGTVGCAPAPDRPLHTLKDAPSDPPLNHEKFIRCLEDRGFPETSTDCANTLAAERGAGVGNLRELPPLRLPGAK